ncbi:MAG: alpha-mannosidase [Spirochaetes bacterium]|nr:alpha-mannosidase [Spirochaetota bacterium]
MLINPQTLQKIEKIENRYRALRFEKHLSLDAKYWDTKEHLRADPKGVAWKPITRGSDWGGDWLTRWFKSGFTTPSSLAGKKVFIQARTGAPETLVIVNGEHKGVFDGKPFNTGTVNHTAVCIALKAVKGRRYSIALEAYSGHTFPGTQPDETARAVNAHSNRYDGIDIVTEREDVSAFFYDLLVLRQSMEALNDDSVRRHDIAKTLEQVFITVESMPAEVDETAWRTSMKKAHALLKPMLKAGNTDNLPHMGLIGHSHLDTAWLWTVAETTRKCARTFSSVLNLMEQYPEFIFLQSAPYHADVTRREYPAIFEKIKARVKEGRWEPNGAMWVEPDCNVPSGEAFVRQLIYGQEFTRRHFGYTADTLWLPDVFGYSGALPQILMKAGVKYFCTTKMAWGEVKFPYDTFRWEGIDGTHIVSHLHKIHFIPDPKTLAGFWHGVQHKETQNGVLCPFGYGDGGGGPHSDMIEIARRVKKVDGLFTSAYTTVTGFMKRIAQRMTELPSWSGELYLSAHRGTLTSIAKTKRLNRKAEFALRDAEYFSTLAALGGTAYPKQLLEDLWKTLLVNQFHDILPGSSIAEVNDLADKELSAVVQKAEALTQRMIAAATKPSHQNQESISLINTLGWQRSGTHAVPALLKGKTPAGVTSQHFTGLDGTQMNFIAGAALPSFGTVVLPLEKAAEKTGSARPFSISKTAIETPMLNMRIDTSGRIVSCIDRKYGREIVRTGGALNRFLISEDVPTAWDNWDINEDHLLKEHEDMRLVSREVITNGPLALMLRSEYKIGKRSRIIQDMTLFADSPRIEFTTKIDWHEKHTFLKAGFDVDILSDTARYEIQYGHLERTRHKNLKEDRMKFEALVHKWMDVSETNFGVALLNDGKYGAYAGRERMTLSLMKSGTHPDARGDEGSHSVTYAILPHGAFNADVVREAYALNVPVIAIAGSASYRRPFLTIDAPNVIIESVKWAEHEKAFVVRLYETERSGTTAELTFGVPVLSVAETDLLEEHPSPCTLSDNRIRFYIKPFEIKTFVCRI